MFFVDNFDKPSWPEGTTPEGIEGTWLGHPVKCSWCVIRTPWWGSVQLVIWFGMTGNVNSNHGRADATFVLMFCTFTFRYLGGFPFSTNSHQGALLATPAMQIKINDFVQSTSWIQTTEKQAKKPIPNICIGKYIFLKNPSNEITADATAYYAGLHCPLVLGLLSVPICCFLLDSAVLWAFDIFCFFASAASAQVV